MHWNLKIPLIVPLIVFLACACARQKVDETAQHTVSYSDFENAVTVDGYVEPVNSTNVICPPNVDGIILSIADDGTFVSEGDVICVLEDANLESEYDRVVLDLENAKATLTKLKAEHNLQYALLSAQVERNKADSEIARMDSLQLIYAPSSQRRIVELQLERTAITEAKLDKKLEAMAIIQQSDIRRREIRINTLAERVASTRKKLETLTIKAPKNGLMIRADSRLTDEKLKEGDNIWSNMAIARIPQMDKMKVKIRAGERDFKQINVNDSVSFTFDAMPGNAAYGKITVKMPVGQPVSRGSKVKVFELEASIDSVRVMPEPGMSAICRVVPQRIRNIIAVPQIAVFEQDSMRVVYVVGGKGFEMRQVETGASSQRSVVIAGGLDSGEVISLVKPKPSFVKMRTLRPKPKPERNPENDSLFKYIPLWKPDISEHQDDEASLQLP